MNRHFRRSALAALLSAALIPVLAASKDAKPQIAPLVRDADKLMSEDYRASVKKVVVLPGVSPADSSVTGSYDKETDGLLDGIDRGRDLGTFRKDIGGIPVSVPIPILQLPGAIFGGISGASKRALQDFRDALTEDLAESADSPLSNDALATDVFWLLRSVPHLEPKVLALTTPVPADTDAILYVSFSDATIDVQKDEAYLTTSAMVTLRRLSDGKYLYENQLHYRDRDSLSNWTENDNAAWHDYANFARHYLGREISAEVFERVIVKHELLPTESNSVKRIKKDRWSAFTKSLTPTLAWQLTLDSNDANAPWAKSIAATDINYEVEIYDTHRLVYAARKIEESEFTIDRELEACKTYRWSVRPSYRIDGELRFGEWMRSNPDSANGNDGMMASAASAYIFDYAKLEINCKR